MKGTLTLNLQSFSFQGVITQNGSTLIINADGMPDLLSGRGVYTNASSQAITHNNVTVPAYTVFGVPYPLFHSLKHFNNLYFYDTNLLIKLQLILMC